MVDDAGDMAISAWPESNEPSDASSPTGDFDEDACAVRVLRRRAAPLHRSRSVVERSQLVRGVGAAASYAAPDSAERPMVDDGHATERLDASDVRERRHVIDVGVHHLYRTQVVRRFECDPFHAVEPLHVHSA
jgi:hypothetical protein